MALNCSAVMNRTQATTAKSSSRIDDCKTFQRLRAASAHTHERRCARARMQATQSPPCTRYQLRATIVVAWSETPTQNPLKNLLCWVQVPVWRGWGVNLWVCNGLARTHTVVAASQCDFGNCVPSAHAQVHRNSGVRRSRLNSVRSRSTAHAGKGCGGVQGRVTQ